MAAMNMILYGNLQRRRPRTYRLKDFMHNNTFSDEDIRMRFRFSRQGIVFLTNLLRQDLQRPTQRNHALSVESHQVLISLKFLACGSFQQVVGDVIGVDKSTVSRIVPQFCQALNRKKNQFIVFPTTAQQKTEIKQDPFDDEEDPDDFEAEPYDGDDQNRGAIRDHIANTFF
ncbi:putative nuclease HARBI1 [Clytia hemisphaerica]|uniref:putative nuclease HARBI1 n=1 Tax=Clytia hemisphaerica TaxID=252671 RepID=UPI0034D45DD3